MPRNSDRNPLSSDMGRFNKQRKCKVCGNPYSPFNSLRKVCYKQECQYQFAINHVNEAQASRMKLQRAQTRADKERLKSRRKWLIEARDAFNAFIRKRDEKEPCISCGRTEVEWTRGGSWDCGHFLSVGSHPELRFEELNAHKQCKSDNAGSGKYTRKNYTVSKEYRERLIKKIGLEKVEWLEGPHEPKKYTIDELKEIKRLYKLKLKELSK